MGVHAFGWDDFDDTVGGHVGCPLAFVEEVVVEVAEQGCVVEICGPVLGPEVQMMGFAPRWWAITTRPDAAPVADRECEALVAVEEPSGHAVVQHAGL